MPKVAPGRTLFLVALWVLQHVIVAPASIPSESYSALCVIGKNENLYVREWVEYHKCLGFAKIYMYDHNSTKPMLQDVSDYVQSGFVEYKNFEGTHQKFDEGYSSQLERFMTTIQGQAYKHCVQQHGHKHQFLGFIDFDEFLVLYDAKVNSINDLLRDYEKHPGLSIYWVLLGSSGHKTRPHTSVISSYRKCTPHSHKFNTQFKTFVNTAYKPTMYSPHRAIFGVAGESNVESYMVNEHFQPIPRGRNKNCTHVRAAVYHYVTKSLEDFTYKMNRGGGAGVTRPKYYFNLINQSSKETCSGAVQTFQKYCHKDPGKASHHSAGS